MDQFFEAELLKNIKSDNCGWVEVICGSMFSGKTEELIRRVNRALIGKLNVKIFKPAIDVRYSATEVVSHGKKAVHAYVVSNSNDIAELAQDAEVVAIDEAQFFDEDLPEICHRLADKGKRVIVAGLDMDFRGIPFGIMPQLLSTAEFVTKVHAICVRCGNLAAYSHRLDAMNEDTILIGETDRYEPLCRSCYKNAERKQSIVVQKLAEKS
jgi:thymidine kinase